MSEMQDLIFPLYAFRVYTGRGISMYDWIWEMGGMENEYGIIEILVAKILYIFFQKRFLEKNNVSSYREEKDGWCQGVAFR